METVEFIINRNDYQIKKDTIYMLCGYKKSGKDTLCNIMNNSSEKFMWEVYANPRIKEPFKISKVIHKSFSHQLKKEVFKKLTKEGLYDEMLSFDDIESIKDEVIPSFESFNNNLQIVFSKELTFRDFLIEFAKQERNKDPDVWCKKAFPDGLDLVKSNEEDKFFGFDNKIDNVKDIMITDWRYPNEFEYIKNLVGETNYKIITIRIFSSATLNNIYNSEEEEDIECMLDLVEPDYFFIRKINKDQEFESAKNIFPYLKNYKWIGYRDER